MRLAPALALACLACSGQELYTVEKADTGFRFTEGPVWSHEGYLLFTDYPTARILKLVPGERATVFREKSNGANGLTLDSQGRLYACEADSRRVTRTDKSGKIEVLAERWEGKRLNAPNDIVVRRDGNIYFTDPAFGKQADTRELDFYGVYRITPQKELKLVAKPAGRPNGIALSPNGRILYVNNSDEHNVRAYDLDGKGEPSNERVIISDIEGVPDGMRVDEKGNLYITANAVRIYSPQGKLLSNIPVPEPAANCAFGGADGETLYVTARTSVYRVRLDAKGAQH